MDVLLCQICFRAADRAYIALVDTTVSTSSIFALLLGVDMRLCLLYFRFAKIAGAGVPEGVGFADRISYTGVADILSLGESRGSTALVNTIVAS